MKIKIEEKPVTDHVGTWWFIIANTIFFAIPMITVVPEWYVTIEVALGIIIIGACIIGIIVMSVALVSDHRLTIDVKFVTLKRFIGWGITIFILTSMLMQQMDTIFVLYLIGALGMNVLTHFWLKKTVDNVEDS